MLSQDTLSQLQGLKSQMEAEKEYAEAVIKGTQSRYGFAILDDGREIFIPPQEMLKAFPDDRVRICIRPTKDKKTIADIEKLVTSPLKAFTGRCVRKGKAVFVEPDLPQLNRWLFIPPQARNGAKEGDFLHCAILRHPIKDGKPQAKVLSVLGAASTPGIENQYCMAKHQLATHWHNSIKEELKQSLARPNPTQSQARRDLTDLEFVSIDSSRTLDIDDALYAEISNDGWTLFVAIADPTAFIEPDSKLHKDIASRGTSVYFHGDVLPMLPEELSQDICALSEGVDRAALVCKIAISDSGAVGDFEFIEAKVRSRAKLSYYAVDRYLNGQYDELMSHASPLEPLYQVYRALRAQRESGNLVMEDRQEFRWILNDQKQIETIEPSEKLLSQRLVEECMVATNLCAARFLAEHKASGPFVCHRGFRPDRLDEVQKFLTLHAPQLTDFDKTSVEGYRDIMRGLAASDKSLPLRTMINRLLTRAEISCDPAPHMGMALDHYSNCTSPLRKYVDFLAHLQIKAVLKGETPDNVTVEMLEELKHRLNASRAAALEAERWLASNYLKKLCKDKDVIFDATVSHVTSGGFSVRLDDTGLNGFVDLRKDPEKFSYDKWTASLTSTSRRFELIQKVQLRFVEADTSIPHQALFEPLAGCGMKATDKQ
jgi:ribonuclease R